MVPLLGPCWSKGWDINATLLFFYSTAPRTSCLGSLVACYQQDTEVARYQKDTEDALCQGGTEVARYHRPFEARSANSTRRESFPAAGSLWQFSPCRLVCPAVCTTWISCSSHTCGGTSGRYKAQRGTKAPPYEAIGRKGLLIIRNVILFC